jgi:hypothetical protein
MRETQLEGAQDFLDDCIYKMKKRKAANLEKGD